MCGSTLGGLWGNRCYTCTGRPRTGETRQCRMCGKDFHAPQWKLDDTDRRQGTYCSRECKHQGQVAFPLAVRASRQIVDGQLQCARCGEVKPVDSFGDDVRKFNGKKSYCRDCGRASTNEWRERYPEKYEALKKLPKTAVQKLRRKDIDLQKTYRITLLDYEEMLASQGNCCAVCGGQPSGRGKAGARLAVDHAHSCCPGKESCGKCIRGLLCANCNTLIGLGGELPDRLRAAADYLERHTAKTKT